MKKLCLFLLGLVLVVVVAVASPFIIPGPDGEPLMSWDRAKKVLGKGWPQAQRVREIGYGAKQKAQAITQKVRSHIKDQPTPEPEASSPETAETLYKWRDEKGAWHFTNQAPPEGVRYTLIQLEDASDPSP